MGQLRAQSGHMNSPLWRLMMASAMSVGLAGCARVAPVVALNPASQQGDQTTNQVGVQVSAPTPAPTVAPTNPTPSAAAGLRTVNVRRGSIADILLLNGRVAGVDETPLTFVSSGTVANVYVQSGQTIMQGQVLIDADSKQLQKDLAAALSKVQGATDSLQQGQDLAVQVQRQSDDRRESAVVDAQVRLRQAQSILDKTRAGASQSDRQTADATVLLAQNTLDRATADLAKASAGPDPSALRSAQQLVASSQVALQAAQADQTRLMAGPDPVAVREAERAVASAKAGLLAAQTDQDKLTRGPDPFDLRAAQRVVDQAQANLDAVTSSSAEKLPNDTRTQAQRDAAVAAAKLALQDAQDRLAKLKQPPDTATIQLAQSRVDDAKTALAAAQDKLDSLRKPLDQLTLGKLQAAVDSAQATFDNAKAALVQLQSGTAPDQLQNAQAAVDAAKLALASALAKRDEIYGYPSPAELQDAQRAVNTAQQALDKLQSGFTTTADAGSPDLRGLQRAYDDANMQLKDAQNALDATHLRAPANAIVAQVLVQPSDTIDPAKPVIVLAQSSEPVVRVNLLDGDKPKRVELHQQVTVRLDGSDAEFTGEVASFAQPASNGDRIALVNVKWGSARPSIGTGARASITVRQKDNALIVPLRTIKTAGSKRYVETLDGSTRKSNPVELGIVSGTDVEILSGVQEGQNVLLDSSIDTGQTNTPSTAAKPTVAPSAVQTPAAPVSSATPPGSLVDEWFTDNRRQWPSDPQGPAWVAHGAYNLATRQNTRFVAIAIPGTDHLGDASITGSFRKIGGPPGGGYGLIVRNQEPSASLLDGVNQNGRFYDFEVSDRGEFGVWLRDNDRWVDVVPWSQSSAVKPGVGAANDLTVTLVGDRLSFKVNDVEVTSHVDTQLHSGSAGVFVGGDGNQVELHHLSVSLFH
jgi:multidrug resistance efflux pump